MYRMSFFTGLVVAVLGVSFMTAQDKKAADPKREADKQAIDKLVQDMVQAFNNKDATALVANWSEDGEYSRNDDVPFRGKGEIQKGYAEYFKTLKGKPKLEVQTRWAPLPVEGQCLLGSHVAVEERGRRGRGVELAQHAPCPGRRPVEGGHRLRMGPRQ